MCLAVLTPRLTVDSRRPEPRPTFPRLARPDSAEKSHRPRVQAPPPPPVVDEEQDAERWDGMS